MNIFEFLKKKKERCVCMYKVSYSHLYSWRLCSQSGGLPPAVAVGHECDRLWGQIFTEEPV